MRCKLWMLLLIGVVAAACGGGAVGDDDSTPFPDGPPTPDAAPGDGAGPGDAAPAATCTCLVLGADFTSGTAIASTVALPSLAVVTDVVPVQSDPVVRALGGRVFLINRFGADNVTVVDPADWTVQAQFSTGAGSNPQDVALFGSRLFVVTLGAPAVQVWDLSGGPTKLGEVDLSAYDVDGNPDAASVMVVGDRVFVTLERLDASFAPRGPGQVVVIDAQSRTVASDFELRYPNPLGFLQRRGAQLLVPTVADFSGAAGCVERITTGSTPGSGDCLVGNGLLGGTVSGFAAAADGAVYLAVAAGFTQGKIVAVGADDVFDPTPLTPPAQQPTDVAVCEATRQLVYGDQATGGIRVIDLATGAEITTAALDVGLPPVWTGGIACFSP